MCVCVVARIMRGLCVFPGVDLLPLVKYRINHGGKFLNLCPKSAKIASQSRSIFSVFTHTITLPGQPHQSVAVEAATGLSEEDFRNALDCSLFKQWLTNIQSDAGFLANGAMSLTRVLIQGVDMFGTRVGFLKFKADVIDKETGSKVPGIVFARGPAVAVLILLVADGETYAVLTEQVRVPIGKLVLELPAGMLDDDKGDIVGTAIREVEEETGLKINLGDLVNLTDFLDPSTTGCKVYPSPGGCDEGISLLLYRGRVDKRVIDELSGKETGLREHGELIRVRAVPFRNLWRMTPDAKVLIAVALYEMALRDKLLTREIDSLPE